MTDDKGEGNITNRCEEKDCFMGSVAELVSDRVETILEETSYAEAIALYEADQKQLDEAFIYTHDQEN